jgi:hypothetical protein
MTGMTNAALVHYSRRSESSPDPLMPKPAREPQPDPMTREVDRLLAGLANIGSRPDHDQPPSGRTPSPAPVAKRRVSRARPPAAPGRGDRVALWARVLLGIVFGGMMTQWPYPHGCGLPLLGYLGAVAMVMVAGAWIAVASWRRRNEVAHILALIIVLWGIVLAAERVLPRIGYAAERASWRC